MKNIKRILALTVVAMMLVAIAIIPASADEIQPRAPMCGNCGSRTATQFTEYGDWVKYDTKTCTHFTYGWDYLQKRTVTRWYRCENCGDPHSYTYSTEYRTVCDGHG